MCFLLLSPAGIGPTSALGPIGPVSREAFPSTHLQRVPDKHAAPSYKSPTRRNCRAASRPAHHSSYRPPAVVTSLSRAHPSTSNRHRRHGACRGSRPGQARRPVAAPAVKSPGVAPKLGPCPSIKEPSSIPTRLRRPSQVGQPMRNLPIITLEF